MAIDNSTVESIFYKERLFRKKNDLVVRFRALELQQGAKFYITHISGERMKRQGTYGLSRG